MWKILHWLFGWNYVLVRFIDGDQKVRRVRYLPTGEPYVRGFFGDMEVMEPDGSFDMRRRRFGTIWTPLT